MSVHLIYKGDGGAKHMRPITSREEYMQLRNGGDQKSLLKAIRSGNDELKHRLVQFNYSCLPNTNGTLKGSKRLSTTVGMDIDHVRPEEMQPLRERILAKKDELGLKMLEESARGAGYHLVFTRRPELSQEANLEWASRLLEVKYDDGAKDITRVFFTTTEAELLYLDDKLFEQQELPSSWETARPEGALATEGTQDRLGVEEKSTVPSNDIRGISESNQTTPSPSSLFEEGNTEPATAESLAKFDLCAQEAGLNPNEMDVWGVHNWHTNLMAVLSVGVGKLMPRPQLEAVVAKRAPNYWQTEDCRNLIKYFYDNYNADKGFMNAGLRQINAKAQLMKEEEDEEEFFSSTPDPSSQEEGRTPGLNPKKLPQGVKDSIAAVGPQLAMPVVTAICPCIGALATGVRLDVHGQKRGLNLISYIAGDFASRKGDIDPVVNAWMSEVSAVDAMYIKQEDEFRRKKKCGQEPEKPTRRAQVARALYYL